MDIFNFFNKKKDAQTDSEKGSAAQNSLSREGDKDEFASAKVTPAGSDAPFRPKDRQPAPSHKYYEVQQGDSLSGIAKEHYGDASKWKLIYEKNKHEIDKPDSIHPGQIIELPDLKKQE